MKKDERISHVARYYNDTEHAERYFSCGDSKNIRDIISHKQYLTVFSNLDFDFPSKKPTALDIGCSSGRYTVGLMGRGIDAVGIDTANIPLKYASERNGAKFILSSVTDLPFKKESFDLVICIELLHHFTTAVLEEALEEISDVIKYGGVFIFDVKNKLNPVLQVAYSMYDNVNLTLKARSINQMTKLAEKHGFRVMQKKGVLLPFAPFDPYVILFLVKEIK